MDAVLSERQKQKPSQEQADNMRKFLAVYAAIPDKEKPRSIAIVSAFMDGMAAQRLLDEGIRA